MSSVDFGILVTFVLVQVFASKQRSVDPIVINVPRHETETLPCMVDFEVIHTNKINVKWFRKTTDSDHEKLITTGVFSHIKKIEVNKDHPNEWNLVVRRIDESDEGIYRCEWSSSFRTETVITFKIQVDSPPAIVEDASSPRHVTYREGDTVNLTCIMTGRPEPTVTWYRQQRLDFSQPEKIGVTGPVLIIPNVQRYAGDSYICIGENRYRKHAWEIEVRIKFKPHVEVQQPIISSQTTSNVYMSCMVESSSPVTWYWYNNNGKRIAPNYKYSLATPTKIEGYPAEITTLTLRQSLWDRNDYGSYKCEAVTEDHKVHGEIYLKDPRIHDRQRPG